MGPGADSTVEFQTILDGKLYISNSRTRSGDDGNFHYFMTKDEIQYNPLCDDFGPMKLSSIARFVEMLDEERQNNPLQKIVYLVERGRRPFTKGAFLIGAYLILKMDMEPKVALEKYDGIDPHMFEPFRDATFAPVEFGLSLLDCFRAVRKAKTLGWLRLPINPGEWGEINVDEYDHYEDPLNGDLVQVPHLLVRDGRTLPGFKQSREIYANIQVDYLHCRSCPASSSPSKDLLTSATSRTAMTEDTASSARPTTCRSSHPSASAPWYNSLVAKVCTAYLQPIPSVS